jgi:signal transduction histidine kinase
MSLTNQPIKKQIRILTILACLAIAGILTLQGLWLFNSYKISKQQTEGNVQKAFEEGLLEYEALKADTVRALLKKALHWDNNYNYTIFSYPRGLQVGFRYGNHAYIDFPINAVDTASLAKDPFAIVLAKINTLSLDELHPLYSSLIGGRDYETGSRQDSLQNQLMLHYQDLYKDTAVLKRIMQQTFNSNGMRFEGKLTYISDIKTIYAKTPPQAAPGKTPDEAIEERVIEVNPNNMSLAQKLQALDKYVKNLNTSRDSIYKVHIGDIVVLMLAVKTPSAYTIKGMLVSLVGSSLLMLLLGFCIVYMLYIIVKQKKLSDIKNDFISNISHELKTPIATALAAVQGMRYFDTQKEPAKAGQYLDTATAELQRLSLMAGKILNSSVFESSAFTVNPAQFNLKEMIEQIIAGQQLTQPENTTFALAYTAKELALADKTYLYQAINNLVDNAVKYAGDAPNIRVECIAVQGGIQISVTDNGPGIAKEHQKHIFDKFFRAPQADGHRIKGHGLGLNYVKTIIEKHGGMVVLTKSDNKGSTFTIFLPQ